MRALTEEAPPARQVRLSAVAAHGSHLIERDPEVAASLVDWLRQTLLF